MQKKEAIQTYLKNYGGDGHSIIKAEALVEWGFDFEFVARFAYDHRSGKSYKDTIFDTKTGEVLDSMFGVYSLEFAWAIARDMEADTTSAQQKMGRGFQAGCLAEAIKKRVEEI